jgi:rSAM/selenodomain-associated transferase 2
MNELPTHFSLPVAELSVVVPVLDEATTLPELFATLARQEGVVLEVIIVDGGSGDGTPDLAHRLAADFSLPVRLLAAGGGRPGQLNAGAAAATAATLLFLHADAEFPDPAALRTGLDQLAAALAARGDDPTAGHFTLRFRRTDPSPSLAYAFYEAKARLDRPGCTHGDQGLLLRRSFFARIGPFELSLPMLAETRLAERIRREGEWLLLSPEIRTSARRFEAEGLRQRQTLNACLQACAAIDRGEFIAALPAPYRSQGEAGQLRLRPYLESFARSIRALPAKERRRFWAEIGGYVRANAWQLAFRVDVRRAFLLGEELREDEAHLLRFYDRYLERLTDHPPGRAVATLLVWLWFRVSLFREKEKCG